MGEKIKTFEFNDKIYRLELDKDCSSDKHSIMLYQHLYKEQKEYLSQMLEKIIKSDGSNGIPEDVKDYVMNLRPVTKTNEDTQTPKMAKALFDYLERTNKKAL